MHTHTHTHYYPVLEVACVSPNTTHTHAERRLLSTWVHEARKRGVRNHAVVAWVRRKVGPHISVWRHRHDGSLACATPCVMCSRELARFDLRVNCSQGGDAWFRGRLGEDGAPESRPTMGQIRTMFRPQRDNQEQRRRTTTRVTPQPPRPDWM